MQFRRPGEGGGRGRPITKTNLPIRYWGKKEKKKGPRGEGKEDGVRREQLRQGKKMRARQGGGIILTASLIFTPLAEERQKTYLELISL